MPIVSWPAGHKVRGSETSALATQVDSLTSAAWTSYTPVWTSSGTAPTQGNVALAGRYRRANNSTTIIVEGKLTFGSTSAPGTGFWMLSLPVNASANALNFGVGSAWLLDSGTATRSASCRLITASTLEITSPSGSIGAAVPWTWATGDQARFWIEYEPA